MLMHMADATMADVETVEEEEEEEEEEEGEEEEEEECCFDSACFERAFYVCDHGQPANRVVPQHLFRTSFLAHPLSRG
ncbi:hypothetical protein SprV_0702293600 [Sparganum proliferum]